MTARLTIIPTPRAEDEVCDFCTSNDVATVFLCTPGMHPVKHVPDHDVYVDDGEWNACQPCAQLIQASDSVGLALRARASIPTYADDDAAGAFVLELHDIFWRHLVGQRAVGS